MRFYQLFRIFFCCLAVAITSAAIIKHHPSGQLGSNSKDALVYITKHLDNTWGQNIEEGNQADEGLENWNQEAHEDWITEENGDVGKWNPKNEETWNEEKSSGTQEKELDEEEEKWIAKEEQWAKEQIIRHRVKRQEGRWNKELERYEITSPKTDTRQFDNDNGFRNSPFGLPPWDQGY